jgi:hypothetical protein
MIRGHATPVRDSELLAAIASGRFDTNTPATMAAPTPPPPSKVIPITTDSGIPSSTVPRAIALAESPSALVVDFRLPPPARLMRRSPT